MAEQGDNPYARLYKTSAPSTHNPSTISLQQDAHSSSQPQWQQLAHQPWYSQMQPQMANGLPWSGHAQHMLSAHDTTAQYSAGSSAPPWLSAASTQHGLLAHDSTMHPGRGSLAPPWLPAGPIYHELGLQQPHAAEQLPSNGHMKHVQPTSSTPHNPPDSRTTFISQTQEAQYLDRAAEEVPRKRQRVSDHSTHCHNPSSKDSGASHVDTDPTVDAASAQGVKDASRQDEKVVLIWDVDETLVLFLSLLDGSFAEAFGMQDPKVAEQLGTRWQDAIMDLCDDELLFTQLEAADQTTLMSLLAYDDGTPLYKLSLPDQPVSLPLDAASRQQLAHAYRLIRHKYGMGLVSLSDKEHWPETVARLRQLVTETDAISQGWLSHARQLLQRMQGMEPCVHHVVVTTGQLIPTLAKLLICGLDTHVPAEDIYSARNETKNHCFRLIEDAFGPCARFCVIGDGPEERRCAEVRNWPFVQVSLSMDKQDKVAGRRLTDITAENVLWKVLQ